MEVLNGLYGLLFQGLIPVPGLELVQLLEDWPRHVEDQVPFLTFRYGDRMWRREEVAWEWKELFRFREQILELPELGDEDVRVHDEVERVGRVKTGKKNAFLNVRFNGSNLFGKEWKWQLFYNIVKYKLQLHNLTSFGNKISLLEIWCYGGSFFLHLQDNLCSY